MELIRKDHRVTSNTVAVALIISIAQGSDESFAPTQKR